MIGNFMAGISISQNISAVLHFQELPFGSLLRCLLLLCFQINFWVRHPFLGPGKGLGKLVSNAQPQPHPVGGEFGKLRNFILAFLNGTTLLLF